MRARNMLILVLMIHALFVIASISQPFHGDESIFYEASKAVLQSGKPVFQYGVLFPGFVGLWHPPTFIYLLSPFVALFGNNTYGLRLLPALLNLSTIIIVFLISEHIFKDRKKKDFYVLIAVALYALNPLSIQSSVILDIDGSILNLSIYLFLFLFIKGQKMAYLILSLVLIFASKFSGPLLLFLSLSLYSIFLLDFNKLKRIILLFLLSGTLFFITFWFYGYSLDLDISKPSKHNFSSQSSIIHTSSLEWIRSAWSLKGFVYFSVPFFIFLFLITSYHFYRKFESSEKASLLLNIFSVLTILFFFYLGANGWGFPKYYITALPAMCIFISSMLSRMDIHSSIGKLLNTKNIIFLTLIPALVIYFILLLPWPLSPELDSTAENADFSKAIISISTSFLLYFIIPLIVSFLFIKIGKIERCFILVLIFLTFFCYFYINISHAFADFSTNLVYGDRGVIEVVNYLNENNISASDIAAYTNIGSYVGLSEYYEIMFLYSNSSIFFNTVVKNPGIRYIIIYDRDIGRIGENMKYFILEKKIGTYNIFKKAKDI